MMQQQLIIDEIHKKNEQYLKELADRIATGNSVIPFIGAGMSCPIYGTWGEYLDAIIPVADEAGHRILKQQLEEGHYDDAAQNIQNEYGNGFFNYTAEYFSVEKIKMDLVSNAARLLPQLFQGPMLTTNLDRVIEAIYAQEGIQMEVVLADNPNLIQALTRDGAVCLWKIHGDIINRESWIVTKEAYTKQYGSKSKRPFQECLEKILERKVLLFLGCSLESDFIVKILKDICKQNPYIIHYAVLPVKNGYRFQQNDIDVFNLRNKQLGRMGVNPIFYPDGEYECVAEYLRRLLELIPTGSKLKKNRQF